MNKFLISSIIICSATAASAEGKVYIHRDNIDCILGSEGLYRDFFSANELPVLIFTPSDCPDITNDFLISPIENSGSSSRPQQFLLTESEMSCVYQNLRDDNEAGQSREDDFLALDTSC